MGNLLTGMMDFTHQGILALQEKLSLLQQAKQRPDIILTQLFGGTDPLHWVDFVVANGGGMNLPPKKKGGKIKALKPKDVQLALNAHLFPLVKAYLEEIDPEIAVMPHDFYPMIGTIVYRGYRILNFDLYHHQIRDAHFDDQHLMEERRKWCLRQIDWLDSRIEEDQQLMVDPEPYLEERRKVGDYYHARDWVAGASERIKGYEESLQVFGAHRTMAETTIDQFRVAQSDLEGKCDAWRSRFQTWGYTLGIHESGIWNFNWQKA